MIIEIRQAGFVNKGAELMLLAVVYKLRERYPNAKLTMAPIFGSAEDTYDKMRALNLYPKIWLWRYGFDWGSLAKFVPKKLIKLHGFVLDDEVDVIIDAAGFSYSDQWGLRSSQELASSSKKWRKKNKKLILLPQALGPFKKNGIEKYVKTWAANADLILAREQDSYNYIRNVYGDSNKIKIFPDFTNLVNPTIPEGYDASDKRVALVPNHRMLDKTSKEESESYLPFMISCAKHLKERQSKPFVLIHEGYQDEKLAQQISDAVGGIPIVKEVDPLHIKGILGLCDATIGSRFHGLVSALCQGVPSLATGWSHKYSRLFEDYGFTDGLISSLSSEDEIKTKINFLLDPSSSETLKATLRHRAQTLKLTSEKMWETVFNEIEGLER